MMMKALSYTVLMAYLCCAGVVVAAPEDDYKKALDYFERRQDFVEAMRLLRPLVESGHAPSQALYAYMFDIAEEDVEAAKYYRLAAEQNDPEGLFGLALMTMNGDGGIPKDILEARALFIKAAELGHSGAINALAAALLTGLLGYSEEDKNGSAFKWVELAATANQRAPVEAMVLAYGKGMYGKQVNAEEAAKWELVLKSLKGEKEQKEEKRRRRAPAR